MDFSTRENFTRTFVGSVVYVNRMVGTFVFFTRFIFARVGRIPRIFAPGSVNKSAYLQMETSFQRQELPFSGRPEIRYHGRAVYA